MSHGQAGVLSVRAIRPACKRDWRDKLLCRRGRGSASFLSCVWGWGRCQAEPGRSGCSAAGTLATTWSVVWGGFLGSVSCGA